MELYHKLTKTLLAIDKKFKDISHQLESINVHNDIKKMTNLQKEQAQIYPIYLTHQKLKEKLQQLEGAKKLLRGADKEFSNMAKLEINSLEVKIKDLSNQVQTLLLPTDPNDSRNVIVEIRGATGGDEANIFAGNLYRMYTKYIEKLRGFKISHISSTPVSTGGFSNITFIIKGKGAFSLLKWESGAHRVQRVPITESKGRVHTSVATVLVMPEAEEIDIDIKISDLRIDTYRASGAGGQHINTTDSAVRITHFPTGIIAASQDGRSQHSNKNIAMLLLKTKVYEAIRKKQEEKRGSEVKAKIGGGNRSEKIRTYNYPQNRVTDHRIGLTITKLDQIIEGDLQLIINELLAEEKRQKIENSNF